jgi:hypothetical protein
MYWFRWHRLNIGLFLQNLFGLLKRKAAVDVYTVGEERDDEIRRGGAFGYETHIADKYYEFWLQNVRAYSRMNVYVVLLCTIIAINVYVWVTKNVLMSNMYFWIIDVISISVLSVLIFYEVYLQKINTGDVNSVNLKNAQEWLHCIGEEDRRHMPILLWVLTFLGIAVEAAAIVIIIISYFANTTLKVELTFSVILAAICAAAIAAIVHKAGGDLYREHHRKTIYYNIDSETKEERNSNESILKRLKKLNPQFSYRENGFIRTYGFSLLAVLLLLLLSSATFVSRANLNKEIIQKSIQGQQIDASKFYDVPEQVGKQQSSAAKDIAIEEVHNKMITMYAALIALAVIFMTINLFGAMNGYKYSFYNGYSERCYNLLKVADDMSYYKMLLDESHDIIEEKANSFFSLYKRLLLDSINKKGIRDRLGDALNARGEYRMSNYLTKKNEDRRGE